MGNQIHQNIIATDIFCGVGGLTRGLLDAGINVVAGFDIDESCKYAYEYNNSPAKFYSTSVTDIKKSELNSFYPKNSIKILVGCAPCQPFSKYTQGKNTKKDKKWGLLYHFGRLVKEIKPEIISMENVPQLKRHDVFNDFTALLEKNGYYVSIHEVFCPDYGIPQNRTRLVLFASKYGPIEIIPKTHSFEKFRTVKNAIGNLPAIKAGRSNLKDRLHRSIMLESINMKRIRLSKPGGTWRDWPKSLRANCHKNEKGKTYKSVYGRMSWDKPSPTITTQFYGYGNGRFGHPKQNRAISLREGAILQTFPRSYRFIHPKKEIQFREIGRMIGNAVPVRLGNIVGQTIIKHINKYGTQQV
jgi:DNA (cytosine-5)-methyltransferase 1